MTSFFQADGDATSLQQEEMEELKLSYISTRDELNAAEQANILKALKWSLTSKGGVLSEKHLKRLHEKMFSDVWKWAGIYRKTARNIGVEAYLIPISLNQCINDTQYWVDNKTFSNEEIVSRFHHQLVYIHPYPNGNGRFARLAADLLSQELSLEKPSWGDVNLTKTTDLRSQYIMALRSADKHDIKPLMRFMWDRGS